MNIHLPLCGQGRGVLAGTALLVLPLFTACQTVRPDPAVEAAIVHATGLSEPLAFRVEGGPLDEPSAGDRLTFVDATRRAVMTDPGLQSAIARVRIAMADADQARLLPNPVLGFVLRAGPGKPQIEVSLAQDIIQVFQIPRQSSAADNRMRQAAADAVTVALDVVAQVQERYATAQIAGRLIPVMQNRLELVNRLTKVAEYRIEAGEGVRGDVIVLNAKRVELELMLDEALHKERIEQLQLARLIGEPSATAAWILDDWNAPEAVATAEYLWIEAALKHRPEVQSVAWQLAGLGDDYALTRLLPWEGASIGASAEKGTDWQLGPSISTPIPVFDAGQARRARITAEQIEVRHKLTMVKRQIVEEVRLAHLGLSESVVHLWRVHNELIPLLQQRRDQAEQVYNSGLADVTVLYLAEQDLLAAQSLELDFERETSVALIHLQRAVGSATNPVSEVESESSSASQSVSIKQYNQR